jgi:hypothetical protein
MVKRSTIGGERLRTHLAAAVAGALATGKEKLGRGKQRVGRGRTPLDSGHPAVRLDAP